MLSNELLGFIRRQVGSIARTASAGESCHNPPGHLYMLTRLAVSAGPAQRGLRAIILMSLCRYAVCLAC